LRHAADREMVRAAALTLHTSPHFRRQPAARPVSAESTERSAALRAWRVGDANPPAFISLHEAIAALPEVRPYPERELTQQIARVCIDYSTTRRQLVMDGLLEREHGIYTLTELGQAVWRVERHIAECYLR
jgi:hypothetical protein